MKLYYKHHFDAAHFLPNYDGKCKNMHGHTWTVEIWVNRLLASGEDMVVDFAVLKRMIDELDHKNLNDFMYNPTAENIVRRFLRRVTDLGLYNVTIKVWESADSCVEGGTNEDM